MCSQADDPCGTASRWAEKAAVPAATEAATRLGSDSKERSHTCRSSHCEPHRRHLLSTIGRLHMLLLHDPHSSPSSRCTYEITCTRKKERCDAALLNRDAKPVFFARVIRQTRLRRPKEKTLVGWSRVGRSVVCVCVTVTMNTAPPGFAGASAGGGVLTRHGAGPGLGACRSCCFHLGGTCCPPLPR